MKSWILEPRDPFIARDGRPFNPEPGARARTLPLPLPSTIAGAFRSRAGGDPFDKAKIPELLKTPVHGPWLVSLDEDGSCNDLYLPAPADIAYRLVDAEDSEDATIEPRRLLPIQIPGGFKTNLPDGLHALGLEEPFDEKPPSGPAFFKAEYLFRWLEGEGLGSIRKSDLGLVPLKRDARIHIAIQRAQHTAEESALFLTEGLVFESLYKRLAMLVRSSLELSPGIGRVGGEGRLSAFRKTELILPPCPERIIDNIVQHKACRLMLITPGLFVDGYRPRLFEQRGVRPNLVAACISSSATVSGWDLKERKPKPTRKLAPAGSVYFIRLEGNDDAIRQWAKERYLQSLADDDQDKLDGWGIALLGSWNGRPIGFRFEEAP